MYFLVTHLSALLEADAQMARAPLPQLDTPADLLRALLDNEHCFHFAAIAVEVAAMDMHHQAPGAAGLLRAGLQCHATVPPALAHRVAERLIALAHLALRRVLDPPAAAYNHYFRGCAAWYLPRYGGRHDLVTFAAATDAARRYVTVAMYRGQPLQPAQPAQPQEPPVQEQPPPAPQLQQPQAAAAAAVHVGVAAAGPAVPLQREEAAAIVEIVDDSEGGEEEADEQAAGSSQGAGVAFSDVEVSAAAGQSSLGPAGVDQGAAPSSSSSSVVVGSSAATVASAVTAEGPPSLPTAPEPAEQQSAGVVGLTQLAELEALVARSIRDAGTVLGEMAD